MNCPCCGTQNIPGDDYCTICGCDLHYLYLEHPEDSFIGSLMKDGVSRVCCREPVSVQVSDDLSTVATLLAGEDASGMVLVMDGDALVGIITERDLLMKVDPVTVDAAAIPVRDIMTSTPQILRNDDPLSYALNRMSMGGFRHTPVVCDEHGKYGMLSIDHILEYILERLEHCEDCSIKEV